MGIIVKTGRRRTAQRERPAPAPQVAPIPVHECEADVAEGLERLAWRELRTVFGERVERADLPGRPGALRFRYAGNPYQLLKLKLAQAVYFVRQYPIPRPKALLGNQHFKALLGQIAAAQALSPTGVYQTFFISAAGSDTAVMNRLKDELAAKTGLEPGGEGGDLLIRLRRPDDGSEGWEVLVRLSPRPLATRAWRVCNREGALNATVAHAMAVLTQPMPEDHFLNLACGSGTLLIERLEAGEAASAVGYDHDPAALACAAQNVAASGYGEQIKLRQGDARELPLPDESFDAICADLPFGNLIGSHEDNVALYPALLREAARVAKRGARAVFITHEVRLMEALLDDSAEWRTEQNIRVLLGGLHPHIFVLRRQ